MRRILVLFFSLLFLLTACKKTFVYPEIQDMTEFRRNFSFNEGAFETGNFDEGIIKSATIVLAQLENYETTDEGYIIYQFSVVKSIKNVAKDALIELYEPKLENGQFLYAKGKQYVLVLARTTDICYEYPVFYNINNSRILINDDADQKIEMAESFGGKTDLKADLNVTTYSDLEAYIERVREENSSIKDGVFNYQGRFIASENTTEIVQKSDFIVEMQLKKVLYENRIMSECLFIVNSNLKGKTDAEIIVTIPKYMDLKPDAIYFACLFKDGNYTVSAKKGVFEKANEPYDAFIHEIAVQKEKDTAASKARIELEKLKIEDLAESYERSKRDYRVNETYLPYYESNKDFVGWFKIEGTVIDYPVYQGEDNDYYLEHDANKEPYILGTITMDHRCDIKQIQRNTMVYGHNAKNKSMFHAITYYKNKEFFDSHPIIEYNTVYDNMKWEVYAVYVVDGGYGYCIAYPMEDDQEFAEHLKDIETRNMYKTDIKVNLDDKILTLVTCSYEFDNARTIVQAKLVEK
ncbi:MAG: class B sortase [Vallitaleaceae bacterium]|nr:class B sortase [Vallitaleaceae bacterium]